MTNMYFFKGAVDDTMRVSSPPDNVAFFQAAQVWAWVICVIGSMGNLVTLAAAAHQLCLEVPRRNHGSTERCRTTPAITLEADTLLLLHLSLCDLLYCAVNLPIIAVNYELALSGALPSVYPSDQFCTVTVAFRYLNAITEWMTLGLLALERCLDMGRVSTNRIFTPIKTCVLLACCWGSALILQLGSIFTKDRYFFDNTTYKCDMKNGPDKIVFYTLETPLPCCLMLIGAASIIWQVWNNKRRLIATHMPRELVQMRSRSTWRSTALVLCLLTLFLLCVIPNAVYNVVSITKPGAADNAPVALVTFMFYWVQYGINFVFYCAGNSNFREAYIQFLEAVGKVVCYCCRLPAPWYQRRPRTRSTQQDAAPWPGYTAFFSAPALEVMDMSKETPATPKEDKNARNSLDLSDRLMSCLRVECFKPSSSTSSFSFSSSKWSFSSPFSSSTMTLSSSASWDSSRTLVTRVSMNEYL